MSAFRGIALFCLDRPFILGTDPRRTLATSMAAGAEPECHSKSRKPDSRAYLIVAKASTFNRKSGLDNCAAGTVLLSAEGLPK